MRKAAFFIILILELLVIAAGNFFCLRAIQAPADNDYRVEIKRLKDRMNKQENVDLEQYPHITQVSEYDPEDAIGGTYVVIEVGEKLYRVEYKTDTDYSALIYMNLAFGLMLVITIVIFFYIYFKIIRPFAAMEKLTEELAKGHLATPLKEERSHLFGRFLWGLDMMREQLEESRERERAYQKERKTLMLSLSHDIKTPLSAIELYEKALSTGLYDTPEKQAAAYAGIHKNAEDLHRYIDEITAASREDFLALTVKQEDYYLEDVLGEIFDYYKEKFATLHTEFEIGTHGNPLLKGDRNRLGEVLQNLLENAIKYGDGRRVRIAFTEEEDAQLIHVHNTGEAPAEDEMVHLFDSFYRGSNVGEKPGSGLGLYISRELMRRMDGELYATAEDGFTCVAVVRKA